MFQDKRCDGEVVDGSKVLAGSSHKFKPSGCKRRLTSRFLAREPDEGMVIYGGKISSPPIFPFDCGLYAIRLLIIILKINHHTKTFKIYIGIFYKGLFQLYKEYLYIVLKMLISIDTIGGYYLNS